MKTRKELLALTDQLYFLAIAGKADECVALLNELQAEALIYALDLMRSHPKYAGQYWLLEGLEKEVFKLEDK